MPETSKKESDNLCYKCKRKIAGHNRCEGCSILRHKNDPECSCHLSAKQFAELMHKNLKNINL